MTPYLEVAIFAVAGVLFYAVAMWMARLLGPPPGSAKDSTYECGVEPLGEAQMPFHINFYRYALVFLVFDVQAVFLFPWAVSARRLGPPAFLGMLFFGGVLLIGLFYGWRKKVFTWS